MSLVKKYLTKAAHAARTITVHPTVAPHIERVRPLAAQTVGPLARFAVARPIVALALVAAVGGGGYWYVTKKSDTGVTTYTIGTVTKGTLVVSVAGTGQVATTNEVALIPKVSGDVISVPVKAGQTVRAGAPIAYLDSREAQKNVRDARTNLASAQLSLEKIRKPATALTLTQAQNNIDQSRDTLAKSYDDGYTTIANAYLDLPGVMVGLNDTLYGTTLNPQGIQSNIDAYAALLKTDEPDIATFKADAVAKYQKARSDYDAAFAHYRTLTRAISDEQVTLEVRNTYTLLKTVSDSVKSTNDYLGLIKDRLQKYNSTVPALLTTHQTNLSTYTSKTNTHLANLLSIINTITTTKRTLSEQEAQLKDLQAGSEPLDIESARLSVVQRQNALTDALETLALYTVRAPFTGTIATLDVQRGERVGTSSIGTLITKDKLAEVSLNEVDIAKVKVGQKVTLTFDAVEDLSISGTVSAIDAVGAVSQGVVSYTVKIGFDTQDERVRPGMSVSAAIITDVRSDVLLVPASAIKTDSKTNSDGSAYIETPDAAELAELQKANPQQKSGLTFTKTLTQIPIETGATDDTQTEVTSGLKEGDTIITRSVKAATTTTTAPSLFGNMRPPGTGGGNRTGGQGR